MQTKPNIILVGFMGTGKSTVGEQLAAMLGMPLTDMDALIEKRAGKPISAIFADDGEARFRELESGLALELAQTGGQIISTGGGIVLNQDNLIALRRSGLLVCLTAGPETVLRRVASDTARPLLAGDKKARILELLEQRRPLYEAIEPRIATDNLNPSEIAERIAILYKEMRDAEK